jgi:peptidyl-prolyl cis-trans isomerase B (cyclophilin B)
VPDPVPTNKQQRLAAQRRLQRQLEKRAELARKRRRNLLVVVTVVAVVLVAGAVALVAGLGGDDDPSARAASSSTSSAAAEASAAPAVTNADGTVTCTYAPDTSGNPSLTDVGTPPDPASTPASGTVGLLMSTDQGDLPLTLDRAKAPCAAASFAYLASVQFFDGSPCHREVNQPTFGVLQCGDPTGSGSGGPSYKFAEEVTPETTYPRGTIAMANSGTPGSTGSQFFLCFVDTQLSPDYTAVGTVDEAGLAVLDTIAAAGNDGSFEPSPGGGAPNTPVTITSMTVVA